MPDLKQRILDYVTRPGYVPRSARSLAKAIGVAKKGRAAFERALADLVAEGRLVEGESGLVSPTKAAGLITGVVRKISSGAGFVIPHVPPSDKAFGDIYVSQRDLLDAQTGDEVVVQLLKRRWKGGQRCGRVVEVVERATSRFVGTYFEQRGQGFVQVDGTAMADPVLVGDPGAKGAQPGDKVVIEMLRFPTHFRPGEAVITRVLGPKGKPGVDLLSIIHEFGLPHEFSEEALEEARRLADAFDETIPEDRLDLTGETIVTIDPKDARDFDDAISLSRLPNGRWRLGVHIADVSHFVKPGTALDEEARRRGNSVYLPRHVIPMLPEVLSNGLASLQQGRVRFTKSVFIEFSPDGRPVRSEFTNTAIRVTRRFAYEDVLPVIRDPERFRGRVATKVRDLLVRMYDLAMRLRARRFAAGALDLDMPEVELSFDRQGRVSGARERVHDESHQIIEEFMLAANMAVAEALSQREVLFLRRVHGEPDIDQLRRFAEFVTALGYPIKPIPSRRDLQDLLDQVHGKPDQYAINYALLRSMQRAEYSPEPLGHYALAVEDYCHFTSPIRRYPDLTVHRLLDELITRGRPPRSSSELELAVLGKHCSFTERRADSAERELVKVKLLTLMADRVGREMDAVITGVERFGIFCQGIELPVEGLVHVGSLPGDDFFDFDPVTHSLEGRRTGLRLRLGQAIRVRIVRVDVDRREMDLAFVAIRGDRRKPQAGRPKRRSLAKADGRKKAGTGGGRRDRKARETTKKAAAKTPRRRSRRK